MMTLTMTSLSLYKTAEPCYHLVAIHFSIEYAMSIKHISVSQG